MPNWKADFHRLTGSGRSAEPMRLAAPPGVFVEGPPCRIAPRIESPLMEEIMPKLCKFTSPSDGKPVYVNPAQVSVVYTFKGNPPDTIIGFRKDFMLGVRESLEEVVEILDKATAEETAGS